MNVLMVLMWILIAAYFMYKLKLVREALYKARQENKALAKANKMYEDILRNCKCGHI